MNDPARFIAPAQLEIVRQLPASCERVWQYLVDPTLRQQWFCAGETGRQPGELFEMDFDHRRLSANAPPEGMECGDPICIQGTLVTYNPPHELAYLWPEESGPGTLVTIKLEPFGEHTRLQLTHERLENPEFRRQAASGWHAHLDLLLDLLSGKDARDFWLHYGKLKSEYELRVKQEIQG